MARAWNGIAAADDQSVAELVVVTCPRCGQADRMLASSYAMWRDGILCGVCGPPHVKMHVGLARRTAGGQ